MAPEAPSTGPAVPAPRVPDWMTWQPDPNMVPTPPSHEPILLVPDSGSPGLFGPRSPRDYFSQRSSFVNEELLTAETSTEN
ncbi:hypothetical protein DFH06DRAFT_1253735 [Mycena polygramma]|nr:hypothetical protein DFH06DRAFT_1253735 [Mycena polygramma]